MKSLKRKKAYKLGIAAERKAAIFLRFKGYRIIERNYRCPKGEIDIVAIKGKILVIIEVKARRNISECVYSITPGKQGKILGAVEWLISGNHKIAKFIKNNDYIIRFDAMFIVPRKLPEHLKDAWRV